MATFKSFEDIESWQLARVYCNDVFKLSSVGEFTKDFALKDQIRRSSGSIMDNVAEGFGRGGSKEFVQFLYYSIGSNEESRSQLYRAKDQNYVNYETFDRLYQQSVEIGKKLKALAYYLKSSEIKGLKFKTENFKP